MQWYYYSWSLYPPQISRSLHLTDTSSIIHLRPLKRSQSSHQMKVVSPSLTSCQTEAAMLCLRPAGWYWCVCFLHVAATTWKCLHLSVFSLHLHHRRTEPTASAPGTEAVEKWWYKFWMIVKYFIVEPPGWTEAVHLWFFIIIYDYCLLQSSSSDRSISAVTTTTRDEQTAAVSTDFNCHNTLLTV